MESLVEKAVPLLPLVNESIPNDYFSYDPQLAKQESESDEVEQEHENEQNEAEVQNELSDLG